MLFLVHKSIDMLLYQQHSCRYILVLGLGLLLLLYSPFRLEEGNLCLFLWVFGMVLLGSLILLAKMTVIAYLFVILLLSIVLLIVVILILFSIVASVVYLPIFLLFMLLLVVVSFLAHCGLIASLRNHRLVCLSLDC